MRTTYDWNDVDPLRRARIADAEEIVKRMNKGQTFYDWIHIGEGLAAWRDAALELTGGQDMDTPAYRAAWNAARPLYPKLADVAKDKAERSYSIWMYENHEVLEAWHAGLDDKQRRNWNHPRSVWRHSPLGQAAKAVQRTIADPQPRQTVMRDLNHAVDRISDAADAVERTYGGANQLGFDMAPEHIAESARNFVDIYGAEDTKRFIDQLLTLIRPSALLSPPLDPAFARSLPRKPRKAGTSVNNVAPEVVNEIEMLARLNPGRSHRWIAQQTKQTKTVVSAVLGETKPGDLGAGMTGERQ